MYIQINQHWVTIRWGLCCITYAPQTYGLTNQEIFLIALPPPTYRFVAKLLNLWIDLLVMKCQNESFELIILNDHPTVWFFYHGKPNDSKLIFWFLRCGWSNLLHSTLLSLALDRPRLYLLLPSQRNQEINFAQSTFYHSRLLLYHVQRQIIE